MQPFEYRSVRYWSKEINGTRTGGRKRNFFNSRRRCHDGQLAAAPVESCQSLPKRSPWGRLGSVLYTRKRLRRMRRRFKHFWPISLSTPTYHSMNYLTIASRALGCCIDGVCGTGDYPLPDLPRETSRSRSAPTKSVQFGPDGDPFPSKTSITRGPPGIVIAVSSDPILPHR